MTIKNVSWIILLFMTAGCMKTYHSLPVSSPRPSEKPANGPKEPAWIWTYLDTHENSLTQVNLPACPDDFSENQTCRYLNHKCVFGQNTFRCQPEKALLTFRGTVRDLQGQPVSGAFVFGGLGMAGYNELVTGFTDDNGAFFFTLPNTCIKLLYAQKDGYQSLNNHYASSQITNCSFDKWGDRDIQLILKPLPRSISNADLEASAPGEDCHIRGRVTTENGTPIAEALIRSGSHSTLSNQNGEYELTYSGACFKTCQASKKGFTHPSPHLQGSSYVSCFNGRPGDFILKER